MFLHVSAILFTGEAASVRAGIADLPHPAADPPAADPPRADPPLRSAC